MTAVAISGGAIRINEKGISMRTSNKTILGKKAKSTIVGLSAILLATTAAPALAQDAEVSSSAFTISGNAAVTTDYRFRGIAQSGGDVAIQGGIDIGHESGFYIGTWGSSINFAGGTELDIYGGWSGELASGISADVGLLYYFYPDAGGVGGGATDFFEPYASLSATLGPVEATVGAAYSWSGQSALANQDNIYLYTDLSAGIPDTPVTLNAHVGYSDGNSFLSTLQGTDSNYVDWSLGVDYAITENLTLGVSYTDTDDSPPQKDFTDSAFIFTLGVSF
ncbi:TorF family putative porin [Parasphingorhabdus sp.]|uniref:TorF family putative porin n=3 Tax=Parasphingorhabdus sp. TaxID=2709688 RepID=UPI0030AC02DF